MKLKFNLHFLVLIIALLIGAISISGVSSDHIKLDAIGITNMPDSVNFEDEQDDELRAVIQLRR